MPSTQHEPYPNPPQAQLVLPLFSRCFLWGQWECVCVCDYLQTHAHVFACVHFNHSSSLHLSVGFFFSMSHPPPAARFPPPPSTPRQQHTPRQHTQRSSSLHTETTRTETTHRDNTHRDNTHRDDTDRDHVQIAWQAQHFVTKHAETSPEFVAGAALCEPACSVRGCGCCVVCGCRRSVPPL